MKINPFIFSFKTNSSELTLPEKLNNPFGVAIPKIAQIAVAEFQEFIISESQDWDYDFNTQKGKMFGILVVQNSDNTVGYLGTVSGKLPNNKVCSRFVPSLFDESKEGNFLTKGMTQLSEMSTQIKNATSSSQIEDLKMQRAKKSYDLQEKLFRSYRFLNKDGEEKNALTLFEIYNQTKPPAAAGECTAPKLLQFAFSNNIKPIAIAEFWWGNFSKNKEKTHKAFYPACENRCRPILEFMLENTELEK